MKAEYWLFLGILIMLSWTIHHYIGWRKILDFFGRYIKTEKGSSVWKGIKIFLGVATLSLILSLAFCKAGDAEIYFGLDDTFKDSPVCKIAEENWSQTLTSNGGFRYWIRETPLISYALQYSHASCALNQDKNVYDSIGVFAYINLITDHVQAFVGKDYYGDYSEWVGVYGARIKLAESNDRRAAVFLKYTQRDFHTRALESEMNYKGLGVEFNLRF